MGHLTSTKRTILKLYNTDPTIVNDDARLISTIWLESGWDDSKSLYENLRAVPASGTITRARRMLHVEEKIVYSKEADSKRYKRYTEIKDEVVGPLDRVESDFLIDNEPPIDFDKLGLD